MKKFTACLLNNTAAVALCFAVMGFVGCKTAPILPRPVLPPVNAAPVVAGQEGKDRAVLSEAAQIDAIAPQAKPHTDAQRAAVVAAPAADVSRLVSEFQARAKSDADYILERNKRVNDLTADLTAAKDETDRVIRIGGYALAGILGAAAAASLFLAAQVPWLGPRISAALAAASVSVFAMVQAYEWTKAHPWVTGITGALLLIAGVLAYANHLHDRAKTKAA